MSYDALVVGAGLAGLTAALRLAERGQRVLVVARGIGATHLAPATIDVLGYDVDERVESPAASIRALLARSPDHPYGRVPREQLEASLRWFITHAAGLQYTGSLEVNRLMPTAVGVAKPSTLVPQTMRDGDLSSGGRFVFIGFRGFKDFYPSLIADNLRHARLSTPVTARALELEPPVGRSGDIGGRLLAERFDGSSLAGWLVDALADQVDPDERVGLPAVLGLRRANETWQEITTGLGRPVFEVSTLPPSIPGIRLFDALTTSLRSLGAKVMLGARVVGAHCQQGRIDAVDVASAATTISYPVQSVVLASGGFASGGLDLDSYGTTRETVFGLPLAGMPGTDRVRFASRYFDTQPLSSAGIAVDHRLRPITHDGAPVYENLHAAGAILSGAVPWKEKSGTGISVATGYAAAEAILAPSRSPLAGSVT